MLPIDTGMNRIGTHAKDLSAFLEKLKRYPHLHIHGLFTHLATADAKIRVKRINNWQNLKRPFRYAVIGEFGYFRSKQRRGRGYS